MVALFRKKPSHICGWQLYSGSEGTKSAQGFDVDERGEGGPLAPAPQTRPFCNGTSLVGFPANFRASSLQPKQPVCSVVAVPPNGSLISKDRIQVVQRIRKLRCQFHPSPVARTISDSSVPGGARPAGLPAP